MYLNISGANKEMLVSEMYARDQARTFNYNHLKTKTADF